MEFYIWIASGKYFSDALPYIKEICRNMSIQDVYVKSKKIFYMEISPSFQAFFISYKQTIQFMSAVRKLSDLIKICLIT